MSPFKGQTGLKRIFNAAGYSLDGLRAAFTGEAAFPPTGVAQRHADPAEFFLNVSRVERALLIAVCLLALIVELLNSAVEAAIDRISLDCTLSKNAKDMGSAAQLVALTMIAAGVGRDSALSDLGSTISSLR
jgi:diacylglycerol kinase (ATP)